MQIRVLGCSGGIGEGRHTTSFLLNEDVLIDCGTGVTTLTHAELLRIDHVFLTHAHLDHILCLPLLLDSCAGERARPLTIHALPEVIEVLQRDVFNWRVWPDFTCLPSVESPFCRFLPLDIGEILTVGAGKIIAVPAEHVVPAVGYLVQGPLASWLFSGDSCGHPGFWQAAADVRGELHVVVECSFEDALREIALAAKHYCASTLAADLQQLRVDAHLWVTHLKPGGEATIMSELTAHGVAQAMAALSPEQLFDL